MKSGLALAKELTDLPAVQVLERALGAGRLPHSLLLYGEDLQALGAVGEFLGAQILKTEGSVGMHPDCFMLRPANKMRQISVDKVRELIGFVQHSPNQADQKVVIVHQADRMNQAAANAFLKTLEEPPLDTTLILLTTNFHDLLPTIRSRVLTFKIPVFAPKLEIPSWKKWLNDYADLLAQLVGGELKGASVITKAYGLIARFENLSKEIAQERWKEEKENLPTGCTDEELAGIEASTQKGLVNQLFREIAAETLSFVRAQKDPTDSLIHAFSSSIETLEDYVRLTGVNFNEAAALEGFLLSSLRLWSTVRMKGNFR